MVMGESDWMSRSENDVLLDSLYGIHESECKTLNRRREASPVGLLHWRGWEGWQGWWLLVGHDLIHCVYVRRKDSRDGWIDEAENDVIGIYNDGRYFGYNTISEATLTGLDPVKTA